MKTFKRFKNIISSNVNSVLDSIEDPEKMVKLMIHDLESSIRETKQALREKINEKSHTAEQIKEKEALVQRWEQRARLSVEEGKDALAKEALEEKKRTLETIEQLKDNLSTLETIIASEEASIAKLNAKFADIKAKKASLIARAQHAQQKSKINETLRESDSVDFSDKLHDLESKIEDMEEKVGVDDDHSSEKAFKDLERNKEVESELAALKESMSHKNQ
jgi:phage shock protein A